MVLSRDVPDFPSRPASTGVRQLVDATMFWNPSGGVRRYVSAKRAWLAHHTDWQHTVATTTPDAPGQLCLPSVRLPGSGGAYRWAWRRAESARLLVAARPDLIESADPYRLAWASLDAADRLDVPAVAFCHSNLPRMAALAVEEALGRRLGGPLGGGVGSRLSGLAARAARRYLVRLYRRFDLVLAPSRSMTAQLRDWGVAHARHQPLGVDCTSFDPAQRLGPAWRIALGIPAAARLLVFVGRFAPEKELPVLAEAVRRLGPRCWLLAVGAGPRPPSGERVIVMPPIREPERLAAVMASADLFVHAGAQETFGLSLLEAMACGVPVVARGSAGTGELVDASVGQRVETATSAAFAEAVDDVLERDRVALGAAARQRALANDWERVLPGLMRHYERLIGGTAATARRSVTV